MHCLYYPLIKIFFKELKAKKKDFILKTLCFVQENIFFILLPNFILTIHFTSSRLSFFHQFSSLLWRSGLVFNMCRESYYFFLILPNFDPFILFVLKVYFFTVIDLYFVLQVFLRYFHLVYQHSSSDRLKALANGLFNVLASEAWLSECLRQIFIVDCLSLIYLLIPSTCHSSWHIVGIQ